MLIVIIPNKKAVKEGWKNIHNKWLHFDFIRQRLQS